MTNLRVVVDTNTLVSGVLIAASVPDLAVQRARALGILLFSTATFDELSQVIFRPKFDRYVSTNVRAEFIARIAETSEQINITEKIVVCRDPKDDQFIEVAINGNADWLITGDQDLLILRSFRGVEIVSPAQFLEASQ
ncbi:putative toxin-antitoxin system toxin component, PIN family [Leptolyngbya sp. KIOST-1]|uniref:putative toxin-antitoxin system toxin component, PIN family n=1 Tax=Leptolyngbya sp. KIOST-1 TaxID=1229172 RepID=UPI00056BE91C|nr:putative toxin-antitoxin system toxin component, PIN family [Leptolyngbya sp. KIOST-1]